MKEGKPFEVSKEVFDRAVANTVKTEKKYFCMAQQDKEELFSERIRLGYGLYSCYVHEVDGKYICTWEHGESCD